MIWFLCPRKVGTWEWSCVHTVACAPASDKNSNCVYKQTCTCCPETHDNTSLHLCLREHTQTYTDQQGEGRARRWHIKAEEWAPTKSYCNSIEVMATYCWRDCHVIMSFLFLLECLNIQKSTYTTLLVMFTPLHVYVLLSSPSSFWESLTNTCVCSAESPPVIWSWFYLTYAQPTSLQKLHLSCSLDSKHSVAHLLLPLFFSYTQCPVKLSRKNFVNEIHFISAYLC